MRSKIWALVVVLVCAGYSFGQNAADIYKTERAFEKAVAEKGIRAGFIEFHTLLGVNFGPEATNARELWQSRPQTPAALTWNPVWIDVSSNGTLAYSIGNSIYRAKGKDDPQENHGHYLSVWGKQSNGEYLALLDIGVSHEKPVSNPTDYKTPVDVAGDKNDAKLSAADSAVGFFNMVDQGSIKAYKAYLAEDAVLLRTGKQPAWGKKAAVKLLDDARPRVKFAKRKAFVESPDLAYVYNIYTLVDEKGAEVERGNFVQVWKLRKGKWLIAADVWVAIPPKPKA